MFESLLEILNFFTDGIYQFAVETWAWLIIKITYFKYYTLLQGLDMSWAIGQEILTQLNINEEINSVLSKMPSDTVESLHFFNVIQGINLLINAFITRFVMSFTKLSF
ncbi:MAG: DUF2523 domain-containing protein [Colwellia sp.]|nr:DUF2523 domain-containing protein [Colwellia sp.]